MRGVRSGEMLDLSRESGIPWRCWCENTLMCCAALCKMYFTGLNRGLYYFQKLSFCIKCDVRGLSFFSGGHLNFFIKVG